MTQTYVGYTPFPHQSAVHNAMKDAFRSGKVFVIKSKRQVGKTTMAENILLDYAINHPGTLSVLVEPTLDQSRRVYKELVKAMEGAPVLRRKNDSLLELEFATGSLIYFKSAEQRDNLRGFTVSGILIVDECAFIPDEVFDIMLPSTDVFRAPILLISTPKLKQGFYYRYFSAGMEGTAKNIVSIDFNDFDTSFLLPPDRLEQYRQMMPRSQFQTEYLGEFLDSDSILFTNLRECVGEPGVWSDIYVGIDWGSGSGGDYTSVCTFSDKRQMVSIDYFNDAGTFDQVRRICNILGGYRGHVRRILAEDNSIGKPMIALLKDQLEKTGERNLANLVEPFTTTNAEKVRLVNQLQVALEQRNISLLDDRGLLTQLAAYEATYNPRTNNVSYNAPQGLHDDNCISTMLALDALEQSARRGNYHISFGRR